MLCPIPSYKKTKQKQKVQPDSNKCQERKCQSWQPPCGSLEPLLLFSEVFGSGEVHYGCSNTFCLALRVIFPKTTNYHFNSFSGYFISQVPFPPFLHTEPMQGKKKGPALIQKPHLCTLSPNHHPQLLQLACQPQYPNSIIKNKNNSNENSS